VERNQPHWGGERVDVYLTGKGPESDEGEPSLPLYLLVRIWQSSPGVASRSANPRCASPAMGRDCGPFVDMNAMRSINTWSAHKDAAPSGANGRLSEWEH